MLRHGRVDLALHALRDATGDARPLLHLHGLGERSPSTLPPAYDAWPGPIFGLDFTGHGASTIPKGGGYTCEMLMADADAALGHLGEATVVGRGLGAYVAVLLAGGRPTLVRGAILRDGPGLTGGGITPTSPSVEFVDPDAVAPPDPWALAELTRDPRPPDYATSFVRQAVHFSGLAEPITVCSVGRPAWLEAVVAEPGVRVAALEDALRGYA
jgi:pimeloyl-ACP methyl ester carboxylesterase